MHPKALHVCWCDEVGGEKPLGMGRKGSGWPKYSLPEAREEVLWGTNR